MKQIASLVEAAEGVGERRRAAGVWGSSELAKVVLDFLVTGGFSGLAGLRPGLAWPLVASCMCVREREKGGEIELKQSRESDSGVVDCYVGRYWKINK